MTTIQPLIDTQEVCKIFAVTARTINNWVKSEKKKFPQPAIKGFPNKWRRSDIENYINQDDAA